MQICLEISSEKIVNLMSSAIEGGDPVTSAHRGGWCTGIKPNGHSNPESIKAELWYSHEAFFNDPKMSFIVSELIDESKEWTPDNIRNHYCGQTDMKRGFRKMAEIYPHYFSQVMEDNIDAPCADAFLQSMLFGEEKYA